MKQLLIIAAIGFNFWNLSAQSVESPYVEVSEEAEMKVTPNEIYLQITLEENQEGRKSIPITEQETRLKNSLKSLGISISDLTLIDANAELANINFWGKKDVVDKKRYSLKLTKVELLSKVYAELSKLQIKSASIYKTEITFKDSIYQLLRVKAAQKAKKKATALSSAIGEQLGKALVIREENAFVLAGSDGLLDSTSALRSGFFKNENESQAEETISINAQTLKVNVYIKFSLK